ncbi:MAG TPA: extracellular solute-binding protein, partial [Corynebacterium urealyticum]|nr:extracellular solute-binding protein [Corynebacterium urealyticum]
AIMDEDGNVTVTDEKSQEGLQALVDAYQDKTISSASTGATEEEVNLAFTQGQTAMAINWPYMYTNAEEEGSAVKGKTEVSPLVGKDGVGVSTLGGYNNGININSKHKATAKEFIEFIINEENQRSFAKASFPPVLASIYDEEDIQKEFPYMEALKVSLENAKPRPASPTYDALSKAVQDNSYAALTQKRPVDKVTEDMKKAIESAQG